MDSCNYRWDLTVEFCDDMTYDAIREFSVTLHKVLIHAVERSITQSCDGATAVKIPCGVGAANDRKITLRKGYQIVEMPCSVDQQKYHTAAESDRTAVDASKRHSWLAGVDRACPARRYVLN